MKGGRKILCVGGARTAKSFGTFYLEEIELIAIKVVRNPWPKINRMVRTDVRTNRVIMQYHSSLKSKFPSRNLL